MIDNDFDPLELAAVVIDGKRVFLDPCALEFNEQTITKWLQESHGWYSYFGQVEEEAKLWVTRMEEKYDLEFEKYYLFYKAEGGTEKQAEAKARQETSVQALKKDFQIASRALGKVKSHLKSFDKAFSNATSLNYRQGKEIEKVMRSTGSRFDDLDDRIDEIIKGSAGKESDIAKE